MLSHTELVENFATIARSEYMDEILGELSVPTLAAVVHAASAHPRVWTDKEVQSRVATFLLEGLHRDPAYSIIFQHLDFARLPHYLIRQLFGAAPSLPRAASNSGHVEHIAGYVYELEMFEVLVRVSGFL
jgi:hypothetical protein